MPFPGAAMNDGVQASNQRADEEAAALAKAAAEAERKVSYLSSTTQCTGVAIGHDSTAYGSANCTFHLQCRCKKQSASVKKRRSSDVKLCVQIFFYVISFHLSVLMYTILYLHQEARQQEEQKAAEEKAQAARVLAEEQRQAQEKMQQMQQQQLAQMKQLQQMQLMQKVSPD